MRQTIKHSSPLWALAALLLLFPLAARAQETRLGSDLNTNAGWESNNLPTERYSGIHPDATTLNKNLAMSELHTGLAVLEAKSPDYGKAEKAFRRAIGFNPNLLAARLGLGRTLAEQGRYAEAQAVYKETVKLQPYSATAHYNLALIYLKWGKKGQAKNELTEVSKLDSKLGQRLRAQIEAAEK